MEAIEFSELVKVAAEKMKDITVHQMLQGNSAYCEDEERESKAEYDYMQFDSSDKQREICDLLFCYKDRQDYEYGTTAYIAGMYDAFRIMTILFPEKWEMEELSNIASHLK